MGWVIALALGALVAAAVILIGRVPRIGWELVGAALLFGVAGYAWQGQPTLAGAPRSAAARAQPFNEQLADQRRALGERYGQAGKWLMMSDGMARAGNTQDAANVLISGLRESPRDPNLWVGMGNALVAHGGGILSPSAEYSYRQAMTLAPDDVSAPYFYGLALANSGQLDGAAKLWTALAARLPKDSALYAEIATKLGMIERARMAQPGMAP